MITLLFKKYVQSTFQRTKEGTKLKDKIFGPEIVLVVQIQISEK